MRIVATDEREFVSGSAASGNLGDHGGRVARSRAVEVKLRGRQQVPERRARSNLDRLRFSSASQGDFTCL